MIQGDGRRCNAVTSWGDGHQPYLKDANSDDRCQAYNALGTPFQVAGRPFVPRASFQVQPGTKEKMVLIAYEPSQPGDPAADVQIRSSVTDRQGRAVGPAPLGPHVALS